MTEPYVTVAEALRGVEDIDVTENGEHPDHLTVNHRESTIEKYDNTDPGEVPNNGYSPRVLYTDEPAWTVVVGEGKTPIHPTEPRMTTPHEIARLQSFPDDHHFTPDSRTDKCRLVGNAVPPKLAESVGESLFDVACSDE